jgi:hypothetical protein
MARRKRHNPEQIVGLLREVEVAMAQGRAIAELRRYLPITSPTVRHQSDTRS